MTSATGFMAGLRRSRNRLSQWASIRFVRSGITLFNYRRCFGFASEGAFWLIFTLPFLLIGLLSAFAWVATWAGANILDEVEEWIIANAYNLLTAQAVDEWLIPLVESVSEGRGGITLIGLGSALYSGSRVFATLTQGARAMRGMPLKGYLVNRGKAVVLYLIGLVMLVGVVLSTLLMPGLNTKLLTDSFGVQWAGFVVAVVGLTTVATVMLYLVNPKRARVRDEIPGGLLAVIAWLIGSAGLQLYIAWILGSGSLYGAISSLVALFIWALVFTTAAFAGMTLNITILYARRGVFLTRELMVDADLDAYRILINRAAAEDARVTELRGITEARNLATKYAQQASDAANKAKAAIAKAEKAVAGAVAATAAAEEAAASIEGGDDKVEDAATTSATETSEAEQAAAKVVEAAQQAEDFRDEAKAAAAIADRQANSAARQEDMDALAAIRGKTEEATQVASQAATAAVEAAQAAADAVAAAGSREKKAKRAADNAKDLAKKALAEQHDRQQDDEQEPDSERDDDSASDTQPESVAEQDIDVDSGSATAGASKK
jgi:uncharacterized BrkB/YihY/UPF0761 family membrane protein